MRRTRFQFLIVLGILTVALNSAAEGKHLFWKSTNGASTVYLLGSIHVADASLYPLDSVIEAAFKSADRLFLEVDLEELDSVRTQQSVLSKAIYANGKNLQDDFSRTEFIKLKVGLNRLGMDIRSYLGFKPWFVSMILTQEALSKIGLSAEQGMDNYFYGRARGNKTILGLESAEYQLDLLSGMELEKQKLVLRYTIEELAFMRSHYRAIMDAWKKGDIEALEQQVEGPVKSDARFGEINEELFAKRNRSMVDKLDRVVKKYPATYFVVVGAGHLVGDEGMVELMRKRGYSMEQL